MEGEIQKLPSSVQRLLSCTQTITSPASIIKELLENAIDAKAKTIEVRLESFGLDRIVVRDNGTGISSENAKYAALSHYTSKLSSHSLSSVKTYGFRGEALSSICQTGKLSILTKIHGDKSGILCFYNENGEMISQNLKAATKGSTVVVTEIFNRLPVRKQYYKNMNKRREVIKDVENVLRSYAIVCCDTQLSFYNDNKLIWQKLSSIDVKRSFNQLYGSELADQLESVNCIRKNTTITCLLPKKDADVRVVSRSRPNMIFIYVNKRPVRMKFINQILRQYYNKSHEISSSHARYPCCVVQIWAATESLDINVEPDKGIVYFDNKDEIIDGIEIILQNIYEVVIEKSSASGQHLTKEVDTIECPPESDKDTPNSTEFSSKLAYNLQIEERSLREGHVENVSATPKMFDSIENQKITQAADTFIDEINEQWNKGQTINKDGDCTERVSLFAPKRPLIETDGSCYKKLCQEVPTRPISQSMAIEESALNKTIQPSQCLNQNVNKKSPKRKSAKIYKKKKVNEANQVTTSLGHNVSETRHAKTIEFSMKKLESFFDKKRPVQDYPETKKTKLIGKLDDSFYVVLKEDTIAVVSAPRVQESVLYNKMMSTHPGLTEAQLLSKIITESELDKSAFKTLIDLKSIRKSESDRMHEMESKIST